MITAGVGVGYGDDAHQAGVDACLQAKTELGDAKPHLAIVLASVEYDQEAVLAGVRSISGDTLLVGSSTAGEITTNGPVDRHSVVIMLLSSEHVSFWAGVGEGISESATEAGRKVAIAVTEQTDEALKTFIMFPDVLVGNGADIVRGALEELGPHFPLVGGASGDDFRFEKTYQYLNDKVYSGTVVGVGISGDCTFGIGVKHGWIPIGMPKKVTKAEGSVLHELDEKPAISVYEDYFGEEGAKELKEKTLAQLAITYPLGMKVEGSDEMLIRDPITVDEHGSITCAAEIPEGSEIQLMVGSREEAVKVAEIAAQSAVEQLEGVKPSAVIIFNCIARNKLFGERSGDEIEAIQRAVGAETPLIGFYTYGEQAPLGGEVRNIEKCNPAFHNETVVILTLA
tara:strand:+ start:9296 stop:10489 length:1194 start_codon:yes stop_codon:yes gene_type:complete